MELIIIRHGTTWGNLERRFIGTLDVDLAPQGEELARRVGPTLPAVEHIYRSPLKRCRQTAELLWPGVEATVIEELRETDFGPFEGKNHEELKDDPLYRQWLADPDFARMPVGESAEQVVERVSLGLARVAEDAARRGLERAAIVSHGGALMGLLSKYGRPEREYYGWMCPNCGGFRAALDPKTAKTVLDLTEKMIGEGNLTAMMVTHNMKDAIRLGNRLIMMHEGRIIYDVSGEEKKKLQVSDLLAKFEEASGSEFANDRMMLA